jgi:uncharacterized SAM-binding protein YcdF (DUF218 family)
MILPLLIAIGVLSALAAAARRRTLAWLGAAAGLALVLLCGCGVLPAVLLAQLQRGYTAPALAPGGDAQPPWHGRNLIVLLGAGTLRARDDPATAAARAAQVEPETFGYPGIVRAYALYRACRAAGAQCTVLISGGDVYHYGRSEADSYAAVMRALGMPAADLLLERESRNTFANAARTAAMLGIPAHRPDYDHMWLVTSAFHLRRSLLCFAHFGMHPTPVRADDLSVHVALLPSAAKFAAVDLALHEYGGIVAFYLYRALGVYPPQVEMPHA